MKTRTISLYLSISFVALSILTASAQNREKRAEEFYQKAVRVHDNPSLQVMYYTDAIRLDPKRASYWANRADAYRVLGNYQQSVLDLDTALLHSPNMPSFLQSRALAKSKLHIPQYQSALNDLEKAILYGDNDYFAYYFSSNIFLSQKKYAFADSFATLAVRLDSNQAEGWLSLANTRLAKLEYKSVLDITNKLIAIPKHIHLHTTYVLRGNAYMKMMQIDSAEACYQHAYKLNPANFHAVMKLAQIAFQKKNYRSAKDWYEKVYPPSNLDSLSHAQYNIILSKLPETKMPEWHRTRFNGCIVSEKKKPVPSERLLTPSFSIDRTPLPEKTDLSAYIQPVLDQGTQGSCVGHTLAYLKIYHERKETNKWYSFSAAFIYNQINKGEDKGGVVVDALKLLQKQGICQSHQMPYSDKDFLKQPDSIAFKGARKYRIEHYQSIYSLEEVKYQLNAGNPVVGSFVIDQSFIDLKAGQIWRTKGGSLPKGNEGHAMLIVGFDDAKKAIKVINSWGRNWADQGFGWIDYTMFEASQYALFVTKDAINSNDYDDEKPYVHQPDVKPLPTDPWFYYRHYRHIYGSGYLQQLSSIYTNMPFFNNMHGNMFVKCNVSVPPLAGYQVRVALYFYYNGTNMPVPYTNYDYATYAQQLTVSSTNLIIGYQGLNQSCNLVVPYYLFPPGYGDYYFIPVLYIDNFGIKQGDPVPIYISR